MGLSRPLRVAPALVSIALAATGFSCDKNVRLPRFDAQRAFADLEAQVAFGPRVPGTEPHRQALAYFERELRAAGASVTVQALPDTAFPIPGVDTLYNVRARFGPPGAAVVLAAHWDSRPTADRETDLAARLRPVPGANDGASGVAVLLEVARVLGATPPQVPVEIVLFDGEDAGDHTAEETFCRGSQAYVRALEHPRPMHAIILDMVGRRGVQLHPEANSVGAAPNLVERLWDDAATAVGATIFVEDVRHQVYDDHVPFIQAGIPAVDLIDMDDPHWHTLQDLPEHCDPAVLEQVGRVVLWHVYTLEIE